MQGPPLSDTDPEAERVQLELLRAAEPGRRAQMALDQDAALRFVELHYGSELADGVRRRLAQGPAAPKAMIASPEHTLLAKLEWYRRGGESSERQCSDILGLLRVRTGRLDLAYLAEWAKALGVADLLERASRQAG